MDYQQKSLSAHRRIIIKVGSSLLVDREAGLRRAWLNSLCEDIAALRKKGVEVLLVSSGAIALGRTVCHLFKGQLKLEESQACAAIGQIELAKAYGETLALFGLQTGQILLTFGDTEERSRYLNARATLETLLKLGVVPVINENDTVATQEIRYGDNDRLAARVSTMIGADLLILLSDIDGLYSAPPHLDKEAKFLPFIEAITPEIEAMAGDAASLLSRGGMKTKLEAGKLANRAGTAMMIALGTCLHPLQMLEKTGRYSYFAPNKKPVSAWKSWISGQLSPAGFLQIDPGAVQALYCGKSLLSAGVKEVVGEFSCGDIVAIQDENGSEIARGLVAYDKKDILKIAGLTSEDAPKDLPFAFNAVLVHRNDMVIHKICT